MENPGRSKVGVSSGMGRKGDEGEPEIVAEINITPLTDVFLVLLIIFMVTSSVMSQLGMEVDLPAASQSMTHAQPEGVILTLLPDGGMRVNQQVIESGKWTEMENLLRRAFEKTTSRLVILEGDRKVLLGSAIELMDHARKAGAQNFAIATVPTSK